MLDLFSLRVQKLVGNLPRGSVSNPDGHHPSLTSLSIECKGWHIGSQDDKAFFAGMNHKGVNYVFNDNTAANELLPVELKQTLN